jgi:hypothetical protein
MVLAAGGAASLIGGLAILVLALAASLSGSPAGTTEPISWTTALCPAPILLAGLALIAGGVYVLSGVKKLTGADLPEVLPT